MFAEEFVRFAVEFEGPKTEILAAGLLGVTDYAGRAAV